MTIDNWEYYAMEDEGFKLRPKVCRSLSHNPPNMIYIPAGQSFIHTCPDCGKKSTIFGSSAIW